MRRDAPRTPAFGGGGGGGPALNRQQRRAARSDLFAEAIAAHQAGRLAEAERLYRRLLAAQPQHAVAMTNLGLALLAQGCTREAVAVQRRALALSPQAPQVLLNLGDTLRADGQPAAALEVFRQALAQEPGAAVLHNIAGTLLAELGRPTEAVAAFRTASALAPADPQPLNNLGLTLVRGGAVAEGVAALRQACALAPDCASTLADLGFALMRAADAEGAEAACRAAIARAPDLSRAHLNLAAALLARGRPAEALAAAETAERLAPRDGEVQASIAAAKLKLGDLEGTLAATRRAVTLLPGLAHAWVTMGLAHQYRGAPEAAAAALRQALAIEPGHAAAEFTLGQLLLAQGDHEQGWPHFEARWRLQDQVSHFYHHLAVPRWQGEPLQGRRILLHHEQGHGDTLQMLRYLPEVMRRGGEVLLLVQPALRALVEEAPGLRVFGAPAELPDFDLHCPLFSLPLACGTRQDSIPAPIPYLRVDPPEVARWRQRLAELEGTAADGGPAPAGLPRIGLVWAGNPGHTGDQFRSLALPALAPLLALPGLRWFSLQRELREGEAAWLAGPGSSVIPLGAEVGDFARTGALLAALDLLVTVDTAACHLAGALGLPAWLLLRAAPEWRWAGDDRFSRWYPTVRLWRQPAPGDWDGLVRQVAAALAAHRFAA